MSSEMFSSPINIRKSEKCYKPGYVPFSRGRVTVIYLSQAVARRL